MARPVTSAKSTLSYMYTVQGAAGNVIGNIQGFSPSANRTLERVRELRGDASGQANDTVEIVPGRTDFQITVDRFETYDSSLVGALQGPSRPLDISQQDTAFDITETVRDASGQTRTIYYQQCWIQSWSKTIREGTITVAENVTVWPTRITSSPSKS